MHKDIHLIKNIEGLFFFFKDNLFLFESEIEWHLKENHIKAVKSGLNCLEDK